MKRISFGVVTAAFCAITATAVAQQPYGATSAKGDDHLTLTGCVVKGDGGYLLTDVSDHNVKSEPKSSFPPPDTSATASLGSSGVGQVLYWFDDEHKLKGHEGQRVEVKGKLKGDLEKSDFEVKRDDGKVKIEAKAHGKKIKATLPEYSSAIGTSGHDKHTDADYMIRKFDIDSVKTISSACR